LPETIAARYSTLVTFAKSITAGVIPWACAAGARCLQWRRRGTRTHCSASMRSTRSHTN